MRRRFVFVLAALALMSTALSLPAIADGHQKTVNASVTPVVVAVNVTPSNVDYGQQQLGNQNAVPSPPSVVVKNTGTVVEHFRIKGDDTANWTLNSTPGANQYVHKFSKETADHTFKPLTKLDQDLFLNVPSTSEIDLFLKMDLPLAGSNASPQVAKVFVTAVMASP